MSNIPHCLMFSLCVCACVTVLVCGRWPVSPVFCLSRELDRRLVVLVDSVICAS